MKNLFKIIFYVISAELGTFVCRILEKTPMNVWMARSIGCAVAVTVALLVYRIWEQRKVMDNKK